MPSSEVMHKFKHGELHSGGPNGPKVHSRQQAIAIMESEKRNEAAHGGHYVEHPAQQTEHARRVQQHMRGGK